MTSLALPTRRRARFRPLAAALLLAAGAGVTACTSSDSPSEPQVDPVATVEITPAGLEMVAGSTRDLAVRVIAESGANVTAGTPVTWTSLAAGVATVNGSGASATVSALAEGIAEIRASAGGVTGSAQVTVSPPPPEIVTTALPAGQVGVAYDQMLQATGGDGSYAWAVTAGTLPSGISLNPGTGALTGIPVSAGSSDFTVQVTSSGGTNDKALSLEVVSGELGTDVVVVNVDFMSSVLPQFGDEVYDGDRGIFSNAGGTVWNPADEFTSVTDGLDEFGASTPIDIAVNASGGVFIGKSGNELQDNGIVSSGLPERGFSWLGLLEGEAYDLAIYVYREDVIEKATSLYVTHAGGEAFLQTEGQTTFALPGEEDRDYVLLLGVQPVEVNPGVWGFVVDRLASEGAILGMQIRGPVPAAAGARRR